MRNAAVKTTRRIVVADIGSGGIYIAENIRRANRRGAEVNQAGAVVIDRRLSKKGAGCAER